MERALRRLTVVHRLVTQELYTTSAIFFGVVAMTTVFDLMKLALPGASRTTSTGWDLICVWPPDVFAVVATMADRTGGYAYEMFSNPWFPGYVFTNSWREAVVAAAREWEALGAPPAYAQNAWSKLAINRDLDIADVAVAGSWLPSAMTLLAIADEACAGIGFAPT